MLRARPKPLSGVCKGGSVFLPKEMKENVLAKRTQRESYGEIEETGGGKEEKGFQRYGFNDGGWFPALPTSMNLLA